MTDNGPPFGSYDFSEFAQNYGFEHITSSPHYPQSNDKVEYAVTTAKPIMEKSIEDERDPYLALLNLRNTPIEGPDCSPAALVINMRTKTQLSMSASLLEPMVPNNINEKQTHHKAKQSFYYDRNTKKLASLKAGDSVFI
ncbi:uncharacterized protein K02A2.6-like [Ylistrum balloti]|uniref:uncharacterized protein K02A2.6-like n=1 Tax=Ylistrum balloti TaxID=509963 RepID=UPI0029058951|nr:uncharacterized protein K02A2.6-like [Ylistrum balloti]